MVWSETKEGAVGMTVLSSLMLGSSYVFIKMGVSEYDPYLLGALAMAIGTLACLVFMAYRRTLTIKMFRHREFWVAPVVNTGVVGFSYLGLTLTTASAGGLIIGSNVLFVALLSHLFFGERLSLRKASGLTLGFLGLVTITTRWDLKRLEGGELLGDALMLMSAVCIALVVVLSKGAMKKLTYDQWTLSLHMFLPFTLFALSMLVQDPHGVSDEMLPIAVFLGLVTTTVPTLLWTYALPKIGAVTTATVLMLESTFGVLLSVLILNEVLDAFVVAGALLTFVAIFFVANGDK
ncbi:MAG: DMT family transporter [Methanomassiliicoccales archaeon]|nr:MAG: DMT family transporter [Methanomassiliicoccales archaeon]